MRIKRSCGCDVEIYGEGITSAGKGNVQKYIVNNTSLLIGIFLTVFTGYTYAGGIEHGKFYNNDSLLHTLVIDRNGYELKLLFNESEKKPGKFVLTHLKTLAEESGALAAINGTVWAPDKPGANGYLGAYDGAYLNTTFIVDGKRFFEGKTEAVTSFKTIDGKINIHRHEVGRFHFDSSDSLLSAFGSTTSIIKDSKCQHAHCPPGGKFEDDETCVETGEPTQISAIGYSSDKVVMISSDYDYAEITEIGQLCNVLIDEYNVTDAVILDGSGSTGLFEKASGILNGETRRLIAYGIGVFESPSGEIPEGAMDKAFNKAEADYGNLGDRVTETHCWSDSPNNPNCKNGVWIRDYRNGSTETALIYNPYQREGENVWLMSEVFWAYYKMISGYKVLGPPISDAYYYRDGNSDNYRQNFHYGYLIWSSNGGYTYPEWGLTIYDNNHNIVYLNGSGNSGNNGNGKGGEDPNVDPYDPWEGYKNAVGIDSVRGSEEGKDDWEYVIEVPLDDIYDMDFRVKLKRKGGVWPDEVEASFYLSEDDIFDSGDVFLGSEDKDLSDEAEKKRSVYVNDVDMADFINEPGEYYVYVAVAYGTGTNRSTSRDKKERVKIIVTNETPLSDGTIVWSPNGAVPGMTCTQWQELADPHSWGDNFLCTTRSEDIRWSADGPIAGMRCTQIYESRDPHFNNNYLCVPDESALNFVWSEFGNMSDMYCVRTDEPKDKHSWDDNYLCWSDSGANGAGNSGIYYGSYDTVTTNTGATSPDVLPASIHLNDASGNVRAIYTPAEVPGLPDIAVRIENIGAVPSSSEQKHKLKTSVFLTGPGYESGWKFTNKQTQISGFGTPGYEENIAFALPGDAVLNEGLYSITVSTDDTDKLTENNELNNTSPQVMFWVQNALPDIAVQSLSVDEDLIEVEAGSKHDITIDVSNIAPVGGDAHFPVVVQLWYDGDQLLGEQVIEAADLIAGGSNEVTISGWTVPFEEGAHTLTATATNKYVPYEANLSNNSLSQDITIIVTPGDPDCVILNPMEALPATGGFDLAANAISFPDTLKWGESLHPWAEQCVISGRSPETRAMWAYARCDGTGFTPFDDDGNDGMKAGQCGAEQVWTDENLSTMDPGMYMIYFISNGTTQIPESDYSNNVQAKAFLLEE